MLAVRAVSPDSVLWVLPNGDDKCCPIRLRLVKFVSLSEQLNTEAVVADVGVGVGSVHVVGGGVDFGVGVDVWQCSC